ncbi:DNA-processing protein DprA [Helicobacter bizzozeronii]|uniref:SMF family protein, DNA processing chain A (DprA) n=4 Tax=Helicobacter bizzozeronii TaxID=56877 RepID=F8KRZ0_HELBC|nr:DNA-processing protein DprA [Helicobacter bizzozeronii]CCB79540.1 SMF family protein, DNA processing chain A (dprA) [Helicobacter bizzozeronii CIII-1]
MALASGFVFEPLDLEIKGLKNAPKALYSVGNTALLESPCKIAIVGTRKPSLYTRHTTAQLAKHITRMGGVVVSGGALGVDITAQKNALPATIMLAPCSLDYIYPPSNAPIIRQIAKEGLIISEYAKNFLPYRHSFLERNRLVVALSDVVVVAEADMHSGSMVSARLALEQQKPLFVLPQRLGESLGTQELLEQGKAQAIYDVERFCARLAQDYDLKPPREPKTSDFLRFCSQRPSFEEAYAIYGDFLLEQELLGVIKRQDGRVILA